MVKVVNELLKNLYKSYPKISADLEVTGDGVGFR